MQLDDETEEVEERARLDAKPTALEQAMQLYNELQNIRDKHRKSQNKREPKSSESTAPKQKRKKLKDGGEESDFSDESLYEENVYDSGPASDANDEEIEQHRRRVQRRQERHDRRRAKAARENRQLEEEGVTDAERFHALSASVLPPHKQAVTRENLEKRIIRKPEDVSDGA